MQKLLLSKEEVSAIRALQEELKLLHEATEEAGFIRNVSVYAQELPRRIRRFLTDFRLLEPASALCLVSGYPVDEEKIGGTPDHWRERTVPSPTLDEEMLFLLLGSLLGDVFGWATQQNGYMVHDVCPIRGHENDQIGVGSEQPIWWHTEDAFHVCRGDYIGLMCLRNPDRIATTFANLESLGLSERQIDKLFEPIYVIRPDQSHQVKGFPHDDDTVVHDSYRKIEEMNTQPEKIGLLHGDRKEPYIRIDPFFMDPVDDPEGREAFEQLVHSLDRRLEDIVLQPGDVCFIDNFKAVHGRRPFKARYDGKDRWMKRINITRDLRRSRAARRSSESRVIF